MAKNERIYKGYGRKVVVKFKASSPFGSKQQTYHNVTEVHKNFNSDYESKEYGRTAFESDIHFQGIVHPTKYISKIITKKENKKHKGF